MKVLISNIIITSLFGIFCLLYVVLVLYYIFNNLFSRRPRIVSYWMDYLVIILVLLCSLVLYIYYQIKNYSIILDPTKSLKCLEDNDCFILTQLISLNTFLGLNNLLFDNIQSIMTCVSISHTLKIKAEDIRTLNTEICKHSRIKTSDEQRHIIEFAIFALLYIGIIFLIKEVFNESSQTILAIIKHFYMTCELILILLTLGSIYSLSKFKNKLLDRNYFSRNKKLRSIYQIHISRMVYFDDFITFKSIIDLVGNIPMIMVLSTGRLSIASLWISYIVFCAYIFFKGSMLAYIDRKNKVKAKKVFLGCFKLDYINFSFGHMEKAKLYDEICLDLKCDDEVLIKELHLSMVENHKLFDDVELSLQNDYLRVNYYLLLKLIYQYFKSNEQTYNEIKYQIHSENLMKTLTSSSTTSSASFASVNTNILNKVIHTFMNKFKHSMIFSEFSLLSPIENKRYSDEFNSNFKSSVHSKVDLTIESLESDLLLQLYPYYNTNIMDILASLDVNYNKQTISSWYEMKQGDKTYNYYSTHDSLLSFEMYDVDAFSEEKLSLFLYQYTHYITEQIRLKRKTFIPFVLGAFAISYSNYKKYVLLYRNPSVFSQFLFFNSISLATYSEREEQMIIKFSSDNNSIGDTEIEKQIIQNSLRICEDDMTKQISDTLTSDIQFIKKMKFLCFPKVNVIITNETTTSDVNEVSSISEMLNNESIKFESVKSSLPIIKRNDNDAFIKGIKHRMSTAKMENGSKVLTSVDLINSLYANGKKIVFKIFFSELFRISVDRKLKGNFKKEIVNNRSYCKL